MRIVFLFATVLAINSATAGSPFPLQVEMSVPFAPTVFPSGGHQYAVYELYLTNFSGDRTNIRRIEVLDADAKAVAQFEGKDLDGILERGVHQLEAGTTVVAYMWVPFDGHVPQRLQHRVITDDSSLEGASVSTHGGQLQVFSPPVHGAGWWVSDGPSNVPENHHRRGIFVIHGQLTLSRRFAIDWIQQKDGKGSAGDPRDTHSYYAYGQPVYAVGDATVVTARDGQPDNVPRVSNVFNTAVPITMDTVGGNRITLDLGGGHYAWYFHLQPGSVQVKAGEHVHRGQPLGRIGCSGDAGAPHLHFEITTSATLLAGEGVPYLIDHYSVLTQDQRWEPRTRELPLDGAVVDFGPIQ